jgi:hypothetical protein
MNRDMLIEMQRLAGVNPSHLGESGPGPQYRPQMNEGGDVSYRLVENPTYGMCSLLRRKLTAAWVTLALLRKGLDAVVFSGEDVADDAQKLRDGALNTAEDLVKAVGYALESDFTEGSYSSRNSDDSDGIPAPYYSERGLATLSLRLLGDVAALKAVGGEVMPRVKKDGNGFYGADVETAQKAWTALKGGIDAKVDAIRNGLGNMAGKIAKANMAASG